MLLFRMVTKSPLFQLLHSFCNVFSSALVRSKKSYIYLLASPPLPRKQQIACLVYPIFRFLKSEICFVLRSVPWAKHFPDTE
jgi:hypothetical protein